MDILHLDLETTSACDITLGSYRYACDPSTRILMFAIAADDEEPVLWNSLDPDCRESKDALALLSQGIAQGLPIYSHNAQFELALSTYRLLADCGIEPPHIDQWRCTLAMCRRAAAPESLAESSKFFGLNAPKDPRGKALIGIFSDQRKPVKVKSPEGLLANTYNPLAGITLEPGTFAGAWQRETDSPLGELVIPWDWTVKLHGAGTEMTVRDAWELFKAYCRQDVRVEQELHRTIKHFELRGDVLASFQFDLRMNWRGVPVNVPALKNAQGFVVRQQEKLGRQFKELTGLEHTQRDAVQKWLQARGYDADNMQAATVDTALKNPENLTAEAHNALLIRSGITFSALTKIPAMIDSVCPDGRVRGTTQWHAARTGRAGGRIIQPHNFRKSTIGGEEHLCYRMLCEGWDDSWIEEMWDSPLEAVASSIRHFIQPAEGGFYDLDFVGVESIAGPWLCGQKDKIESILRGEDQYKVMASRIAFNCKYEEVTKEQRQVGKVLELQCIYGTGAKGMRNSLAAMGVYRTRAECKVYVDGFRKTFNKYPEAWNTIEDAAKKAIANPGKIYLACEDKIQFQCGRVASIPYLTARLPSGRKLYYPHPTVKPQWKPYDEEEMEEEPWKREEKGYWIDSLSYYGKQPNKSIWGRVHTWGSKIFENLSQAICVDLLNTACIAAERVGYPICLIVHDQALCETAKSSGNLAHFKEVFCTKDEWAHDLPLSASGDEVPYYLKD